MFLIFLLLGFAIRLKEEGKKCYFSIESVRGFVYRQFDSVAEFALDNVENVWSSSDLFQVKNLFVPICTYIYTKSTMLFIHRKNPLKNISESTIPVIPGIFPVITIFAISVYISKISFKTLFVSIYTTIGLVKMQHDIRWR